MKMAKVSDGKVVNEDYLHISGETPIRLEEHETATMSTEAHEKFAPSEGQPIRLHHQLAGLRSK
jgi:hypothetical protein